MLSLIACAGRLLLLIASSRWKIELQTPAVAFLSNASTRAILDDLMAV